MKYTSLNAQIADLECRNRELDNIIGPFKEQLIQFEIEREQLMSKTENTEKELRALELEHARALGHQNHKQKIRHVVNLTETIAEQKKVCNILFNNFSPREFILFSSKFICIRSC
jgi:hyaluronan-mediated motility receptor